MTKKQKLIIAHVVQGNSNKEIGDLLGIAEKTVKGHLTKIYEMESVATRAQLIVKYLNPHSNKIESTLERL